MALDPWESPTHGFILAHWNKYMTSIITIQRAFRQWKERCKREGWPSAHNAYHWIHWIDVRRKHGWTDDELYNEYGELRGRTDGGKPSHRTRFDSDPPLWQHTKWREAISRYQTKYGFLPFDGDDTVLAALEELNGGLSHTVISGILANHWRRMKRKDKPQAAKRSMLVDQTTLESVTLLHTAVVRDLKTSLNFANAKQRRTILDMMSQFTSKSQNVSRMFTMRRYREQQEQGPVVQEDVRQYIAGLEDAMRWTYDPPEPPPQLPSEVMTLCHAAKEVLCHEDQPRLCRLRRYGRVWLKALQDNSHNKRRALIRVRSAGTLGLCGPSHIDCSTRHTLPTLRHDGGMDGHLQMLVDQQRNLGLERVRARSLYCKNTAFLEGIDWAALTATVQREETREGGDEAAGTLQTAEDAHTGPDAEGLVAMMDELLGAEHTAPLDDEADDTGVYGGVYGGGYASQLQNFREDGGGLSDHDSPYHRRPMYPSQQRTLADLRSERPASATGAYGSPHTRNNPAATTPRSASLTPRIATLRSGRLSYSANGAFQPHTRLSSSGGFQIQVPNATPVTDCRFPVQRYTGEVRQLLDEWGLVVAGDSAHHPAHHPPTTCQGLLDTLSQHLHRYLVLPSIRTQCESDPHTDTSYTASQSHTCPSASLPRRASKHRLGAMESAVSFSGPSCSRSWQSDSGVAADHTGHAAGPHTHTAHTQPRLLADLPFETQWRQERGEIVIVLQPSPSALLMTEVGTRVTNAILHSEAAQLGGGSVGQRGAGGGGGAGGPTSVLAELLGGVSVGHSNGALGTNSGGMGYNSGGMGGVSGGSMRRGGLTGLSGALGTGPGLGTGGGQRVNVAGFSEAQLLRGWRGAGLPRFAAADGTWSMLELTLGGMAKADLLGGYLLNPDPDAHTGTGSHTQTPRTRPKAASPGRRAGQPLPPTGMQARAAGLKARSARMSASGVASSSNDKPAAFGALPEALMSSGGTADGDLNSNSNPDSNKPGLSVVTSDLLALRRGQWLAVVIADALLAQLPRPKRVPPTFPIKQRRIQEMIALYRQYQKQYGNDSIMALQRLLGRPVEEPDRQETENGYGLRGSKIQIQQQDPKEMKLLRKNWVNLYRSSVFQWLNEHLKLGIVPDDSALTAAFESTLRSNRVKLPPVGSPKPPSPHKQQQTQPPPPWESMPDEPQLQQLLGRDAAGDAAGSLGLQPAGAALGKLGLQQQQHDGLAVSGRGLSSPGYIYNSTTIDVSIAEEGEDTYACESPFSKPHSLQAQPPPWAAAEAASSPTTAAAAGSPLAVPGLGQAGVAGQTSTAAAIATAAGQLVSPLSKQEPAPAGPTPQGVQQGGTQQIRRPASARTHSPQRAASPTRPRSARPMSARTVTTAGPVSPQHMPLASLAAKVQAQLNALTRPITPSLSSPRGRGSSATYTSRSRPVSAQAARRFLATSSAGTGNESDTQARHTDAANAAGQVTGSKRFTSAACQSVGVQGYWTVHLQQGSVRNSPRPCCATDSSAGAAAAVAGVGVSGAKAAAQLGAALGAQPACVSPAGTTATLTYQPSPRVMRILSARHNTSAAAGTGSTQQHKVQQHRQQQQHETWQEDSQAQLYAATAQHTQRKPSSPPWRPASALPAQNRTRNTLLPAHAARGRLTRPHSAHLTRLDKVAADQASLAPTVVQCVARGLSSRSPSPPSRRHTAKTGKGGVHSKSVLTQGGVCDGVCEEGVLGSQPVPGSESLEWTPL